jgi:hypothetical protein
MLAKITATAAATDLTVESVRFTRKSATGLIDADGVTRGWIHYSGKQRKIVMTLPFLLNTPMAVDSAGWDDEDAAIKAAKDAWKVFAPKLAA